MAGVIEQGNESWGDALQNKFDNLKKELLEVWGPETSDDELKIADGELDWKFAEFLLSDESRLNLLKRYVDIIRNDSNLNSKAWKAIDDLATFLDDIENQDRMKKDYDEFMRKIQTPKKLNSMKSWEIRRLNIYLWSHEEDALAAYNAMKPIVWKYDENKMKSEDRRFFESVWNTLQSNYSGSDKFMEADYPAIKWLQPTVASLKTVAGESWDGKNESINIPDAENSIVDKSKVKEKVEWINNQRIESNREKVKNITITVDDLSKFTKKDWVLKYEWVEFTVDKMMELFWDKIKSEAGNWTEFVNDSERDSMVDECKGDIFTKLKDTILSQVQEEQDPTSEVPEVITQTTDFLAPKDSFKAKQNLKDKIKDLGFYDGNEEGDTVKFNITKVKEYLEGLTEKRWSELKGLGTEEKQLWVISVQIALNYLNSKDWDYKDKCDVQWLDGIRKWRTRKWVKGFQEKWNELHSDKRLAPDGAPGKETIKAILEALWWTASEQPAATGEQPAATGEQPVATGEQPAATGEQPVATGEQPAATGEQPAATGEQPAATGEQPAATGEQPAATE